MPMTIIVVDLIGVVLVAVGFLLAFRQDFVRRWWAALRQGNISPARVQPLTNDDPARYVLRISGMMILAFGIVIALLFTVAHYSLTASL
ncbi:hypothetical protein [Sphingopyxis sp.]|uniref:hypothetical protein n=1 Tax=Sphingopyxis sp. TaxID=1908224 RepID=UPI003BAD363E